MKKSFILLSVLGTVSSFAQVGINNSNPKATLDITASPNDATKFDGVIAPRINGDQLRAKTYTANQNAAIVFVTVADSAPAGQTIDVTQVGYYYFSGPKNKWILITSDDWHTTGNSGTVALDAYNNPINFIGTKDGANLMMRAGKGGFGELSPFAGYISGYDGASTDFSTRFGLTQIGSGKGNTSFGFYALGSGITPLSGAYNVAMGAHSLFKIAAGNYNTAIGRSSGYWQRGGDYNTFLGAMQINPDTGINTTPNTAVGSYNITLGASVNNVYLPGSYQLNIGNSIFGININDGADKIIVSDASGNINSVVLEPLKNDRIGIATPTPKSTLEVGGSLSMPIKTAGNYALGDNDYTILATGDITLPTASTNNTGRIYNIVYNNSFGASINLIGTIIVAGTSYNNYQLSKIIISDSSSRSVTIQSDGSNWYLISRFTNQ